jgi:hypothetical protein
MFLHINIGRPPREFRKTPRPRPIGPAEQHRTLPENPETRKVYARYPRAVYMYLLEVFLLFAT